MVIIRLTKFESRIIINLIIIIIIRCTDVIIKYDIIVIDVVNFTELTIVI